ncbi:MAG: zinc-binding dehydrogenase [Gemmatimonadaceae bacterium]|nr:zinc-binding dehydrogenase [Gemmatimonadaceae bacterium]
MRAVQLTAPRTPVVDANIPRPDIGPDDVLVRIRAAGICHSDVHYRGGKSRVEPLPLTLGHEVAGEIEAVGANVPASRIGERVALHYLVTCGGCDWCINDREMFCDKALMLGHFTDGGWAEYIAVPSRNAVVLPDNVPFEHGAIMMCSSATSLHALRQGQMTVGARVLVIGAGGLGMSAIQLAQILGARQVLAVDRDAGKLALAARYGAVTVQAGASVSPEDLVSAVMDATQNAGVDVVLDLVAHESTVTLGIAVAAPRGRVVIVGINDRPLPVDTYRGLIGREVTLVGSNDHTLRELEELMGYAADGRLRLHDVVAATVPLDAAAINGVLDALERGQAPTRTVVVP